MLAVACVHRPDDADRIIAAFATAEDQRACERYTRPSRRRQSLASRALLRASLVRLFGEPARSWTICANSHNKPLVRTTTGREPAQVSVAHSRTLVACAITDIGPIGIDVEYCVPRRRIEAIAGATFGFSERAAVDREGVGGFYKIWTLREAMAKASGLGIVKMAAQRDLFAVAPVGKPWTTTIGRECWTFYHQRLLRKYALSLALKHE
jgi:4'-phosphopantetheinyl transferase